MKSKKLLFILPLLGLLLACEDTAELYDRNSYIGGDFDNNWYSVWNSELKGNNIQDVHSITLDRSQFFSGSGDDLSPAGTNGRYGHADLAAKHPEAVRYKNKKGDITELPWLYEGSDIINNGIGVWADQSSLVGKVYGQTKKLSLIDESFSKGILSKLYNGQIRCNAWSSLARVEIDETGYGTIFPKSLVKSDYFAISLNGGSNTNDGGHGRISSYKLNVSFYKYKYKAKKYDQYSVSLPGVKLCTNVSSELTSLVGFYFSDIKFDGINSFDPKGIVGMSVTFEIEDDSGASNSGSPVTTTSNMKDGNEFHTCLMLYEVFFPDSSWSD